MANRAYPYRGFRTGSLFRPSGKNALSLVEGAIFGAPYGTFDTGIFDTGIFDTVIPVQLFEPIKASLDKTQGDDVLVASAGVRVAGAVSVTNEDDQVSATINKPLNGEASATQDDDTLATVEPYFVAPSYGTWAKRQNKKKPQAPQLPPPVQAGEIVIDEAVLRQMEEERLAALVLKKKSEALQTVEELRAAAVPSQRPKRSISLDPKRFDVVETTPETRRQVISLFRPPPKPVPMDTVRGSITLHTLGPRNLPEPDIRKARYISLRRDHSRTSQTG